MNSTRVMKEVRQLAWPWAFVTSAAILSLFHFPRLGFLSTAHVLEMIGIIGAFLGIPLLAALSIGAEFQHRTFALNLAQPVPRNEIWRLKMSATVAAILVPAALYSRSALWESGPTFWIGVAVITSLTAGTMFWTLVARSIVGGLGLSACAVGVGELVWLYLADQFGIVGNRNPLPAAWVWGTAGAAIAYSAVVIWLGRRKLLTFEAVEGMQAGETEIPGSRFMPGFLFDWFRARPTGPILNLVRREFHLLRVVWALVLLVVLDWGYIAAFGLFEKASSMALRSLQLVAIGGAATASGLIAVLAGVLSLGEEKNWGTHEWHMTVPVSVSRQWAVKLLVALFTSVVGAAAPPLAAMIVRGWLQGTPLLYVSREMLLIAPVEAALITFVAFWCASIVKGTMRAKLWVFPLFFGLALAAQFGSWIFTLAGGRAVAVLQDVIWKFDPVAVSGVTSRIFEQGNLLALGLLVLAPGVVVATIQSYRFFRAQAEDSNLRFLKCAIPLVITATICGFVVATAATCVTQGWEQQATLINETHRASESLQPGSSSLPLQLTAEDLAKASPISDRTRQWLAGSSVMVAPTFPELHLPPPRASSSRFPRTFSVYAPAVANKEDVPYAAVIHRASGTTCYIAFSTSRHARFGYAGGQCE